VASERRFLARTEAPPQEQMLAFVRTNIDALNPHVVALDAGRVVGWADIRPSNVPAMSHCGTLGMGVLAAYRGQGLGRRLLDAVVLKAWQAGLERIELEVRHDNDPAIALYESSGTVMDKLHTSLPHRPPAELVCYPARPVCASNRSPALPIPIDSALRSR
jgi:ribosomal protein S18 acetylase RimI-like enzyme